MTPSAHRLSIERIELAARIIDRVLLHTPQFVCDSLGAELGVRLALKIETLNPIRSFKGRGADFLVSQATPNVPLLCASAGNFGQAMHGLVDDAILVGEDAILRSVRLLHRHAGIVVEPSGAVGVAALLEQREMFRGQMVGTIVTGGNLTADQMAQWQVP